MIRSISISNYKSIRNITLKNIPNLAIFVGANASGKSNFIDSLEFLSMVFREGLVSAVRAKGGYENICFRRAKRAKGGLTFNLEAFAKRGRTTYLYEYYFSFRARRQAILAEYEVTKEALTVSIHKKDNQDVKLLHISRVGNEVPIVDKSSREADDMRMVPVSIIRDFVKRAPVPADELLVTRMLIDLPPFDLIRDLMSSCRVFQISPHVARETGIPERSPELGRHGENLPAAIEYLKRSEPKEFQKLVDHLRHTVPSMDRVETAYVETKALGLYFVEKGVGKRWFSQDVSDGTISTVSIFLPLVDPRIRVVAIEEPENSLHPWILRHFVDACKTQASGKQIFLTTQSVIAVNDVPLESLYIVRRKRGETTIDRCIDIFPETRQVLQEQLMGLGEYWDTGALAGVPEYGEQLPLFSGEEEV